MTRTTLILTAAAIGTFGLALVAGQQPAAGAYTAAQAAAGQIGRAHV